MNALRNPLKIAAFSLVASVLFGGCASTHKFQVDALNNPELDLSEAYSFQVYSADPSVRETDLEFQEAAKYVRTALSAKGLYEAPYGTDADLAVEIDYKVSEPKVDYRRVSRPVYAMTGGGTQVRYATITDSEGNTRVVAYRVNIPARPTMVGSEETVQPIVVYEKVLRIVARDKRVLDQNENPTPAWVVVVRNRDESDDIRKYLPLMTAAAVDHMGTETERQVEVTLREEGEEIVEFIKQGF